MPNSKKETVSESEEINNLQADIKDQTHLASYYPDHSGDHSFQTQDPEDGFTDFLNRIEARKNRVRSRIFPENSN